MKKHFLLAVLSTLFLTSVLPANDDDKLDDAATKSLLTGEGAPREATPDEIKKLKASLNGPDPYGYTAPVIEVAPTLLWKEDTTGEDINTPSVWNPLLQKSNEGDVQALYIVGLCYARGHPRPQNFKRAYDSFFRAAEKGHAESAFFVARCLELRVAELPEEHEKMRGLIILNFYGKAKKSDNPLAFYYYGRFSESLFKSKNGYDDITKAAVKGYAPAQYELALRIREGEDWKHGYNSSNHLLKTSAKQGYAKAQYELGRSLTQGLLGIEKNQTEAYAWLSTAIANGILDEAKALVILKSQMNQAELDAGNKMAAEYQVKFKTPPPFKNPLL